MKTIALTDKNGSFTAKTFNVVGFLNNASDNVLFLNDGTDSVIDQLHQPQPSADNAWALINSVVYQVTIVT